MLKSFNKRRFVPFVTLMVLVLMGIGVMSTEGKPEQDQTPLLVDHDPIAINSTTAFHERAEQEEWAGEGTVEDPYIIENYNIVNTQVNHSAIFVTNTTVSFVLRDIIVKDNVEGSGGIHLVDVRGNITIERVQLSKYRAEGIFLSNATKVTIQNTNITQGYLHALVAFTSPNLTVRDSIFGSTNPNWSNQGSGVYILDNSHNLTFERNIVSYNRWHGFFVHGCDNLLIHNNTVDHNTLGTVDFFQLNGFSVQNATNVTVTQNTITFNRGIHSWGGVQGMNLFEVVDALIYDNEISFHLGLGITLGSCENITIYLNRIFENANQFEGWGVQLWGMALDVVNSTNSWDKDGVGNYWDDYLGEDVDGDGLGDEPYAINGPNPDQDPNANPFIQSGNYDNHPIMSLEIIETFRPGYEPPIESSSTTTQQGQSSNSSESTAEESPGFDVLLGVCVLLSLTLVKSRKKL